MIKKILPILLFTFLMACQNDTIEQQSIVPTTTIISSKISAVLIFKVEQKMELWNNGQLNQQFDLLQETNAPIGIFEVQEINAAQQIQLVFPNKFYQSKMHPFDLKNSAPLLIQSVPQDLNSIGIVPNDFKILQTKLQEAPSTTFYISPNDPRPDNQLTPCFACPHWLTELYSSLQLHLAEFRHIEQ